MEFKSSFIAIIFFSSWVYLGSSQEPMQCMTKLLPCQDFFTSPASPAPSACCVSLKNMIKNDQWCLCDIFNNIGLLNTYNISQEEALKLPQACGSPVDITFCESSSDGESSPSADSSDASLILNTSDSLKAAPAGADPKSPTSEPLQTTSTSSTAAAAPGTSNASKLSAGALSSSNGFGILVLFAIAWMSSFALGSRV